jgi:hypothetical protein
MPGLRKTPTRPLRLPTFSRDKLCLSSGSGIAGILFGVIFSGTGLLVLAGLGYMLLGTLGVVPPHGNLNPDEMPNWKLVLCYLGVIAIAGVHLFFGTLLLCLTNRVTIDRVNKTVNRRTGWLGLRCERRQLTEFQAVGIVANIPASENAKNTCEESAAFKLNASYTIELQGSSVLPLPLGKVTRSYELAQDVANEVAQFTHKPICKAPG